MGFKSSNTDFGMKAADLKSDFWVIEGGGLPRLSVGDFVMVGERNCLK